MTYHTAAPWSVTRTPANATVRPNQLLVTSKQDDVAVVLRPKFGGDADANAKLLAASPEMFDLLREALVLLDSPDADEFEANRLAIDIRAMLDRIVGK